MAGLSAHADPNKVSITIQDISVREVMEMLSAQRRLNIFVADGIDARVSVNVYDMSVEDAIEAIADSAGLAVERRNGNYFIVERNEVGRYNASGLTEVKAFKVQYSDTSQVETILKEHLSSLGKITTLTDRSMLVVEDMPDFMRRIEVLLEQIDREPKQILIEAKILEVTLTDGESFGIDWAKLFEGSGGSGAFGVQGLSNPGSPGLFFEFVGPNIQVALDMLRDRGRLRTLSTPKLLAMEDREARTQVGTRLGYRVTTTINQVTSESIEFLETGIILRVTPSVDRQGMILLDIHPEVSQGLVSDDGIPNKSTTQLSTRMLVPDGRTIFLGGLIRRSTDESREGVPVLGDIPGVGALFSNRSHTVSTTEIVVLITPKLMDFRDNAWNRAQVESTSRVEEKMTHAEVEVREQLDSVMGDGSGAPGAAPAEMRDSWESTKEFLRDVTSGG
jgi:type II secretory pathway component GspD/PulD (secretin)